MIRRRQTLHDFGSFRGAIPSTKRLGARPGKPTRQKYECVKKPHKFSLPSTSEFASGFRVISRPARGLLVMGGGTTSVEWEPLGWGGWSMVEGGGVTIKGGGGSDVERAKEVGSNGEGGLGY